MFRDDWVRFGFGNQLKPHSKTLPFVIDYSGARPHPEGITDPLRLAQEACWRIYMDYPGPLTLLVSGGVDSQAMAYAFKTAGIPFRAVTVRYNNGINDYDFKPSLGFYRRHDIAVETLGLDLLAFHYDEMWSFAERYQNHSPHFLTHLKLASMITEGTVVSAGCIINRSAPSIGRMDYSAFGFERYSRIAGQPMVGYFFTYDPHLVYETLRIIPKWTSNDFYYETKCQLYWDAGFPVYPQSQKLHGFERLKEFFDTHHVGRSDRLRYKGRKSQRPYDLLFRYPLIEQISYSTDQITRF